ncbi:M23 family metallopeptidase [Candidatus Accumulibacter sp. ACC003]|uniref:M23 family metallopeptidase n=1 Tax=Candidatus Accumulibacter sp. ACC003 TaxID=2823334 RepID=UPI0025C67621|nr:M23 family metallopeptidase [Candidatus Accumulibacter sp. ACC003]
MNKVKSSFSSLSAAALLGALLGILPPASAYAALPRAASVPGGVALLSLGPVIADAERPRAWLGEQQVLIVDDDGQWVAVVGLALETLPGSQQLRVQMADETRFQAFDVKAKDYPEQRITIKDSSKVELSASDLARVTSELATIQRLKRHWRDAADTDVAFMLPAQGRQTGRFGVRRFFNGEARSAHAGFDIAAARGTAVRASASGQVLAVDDYFFNGKTVFVDHGNGLISMYCHLERSTVQAGDAIAKGQGLGFSGMSGRATGPHLHWSVILNGAMVDPELFIATAGKTR